ncbi:rod shape-determining protein [Methanolobus bombayensis]|uniref:rod shape-determining protein n=1 Tax=Methanolobus bombayensis TaxID=38023 RepID=UPI001AEA88AB|nr:rod shape-determining protein [Methanolobus bombayensis]MBP1909878.1 rod shape-determining protein MreB [Methanolobus bombayensis]
MWVLITITVDYMEGEITSDKCLYIGIDAGMYKTSVCSSEGKKFSERSLVAFSSENGNDLEKVLAGKDALELEDGKKVELFNGELKSEENTDACRRFLKHVLEKNEVVEKNTYAIIGVPANADKAYKKKLLELANEVFTGAMLVDELFCAAYKNNLPDRSIIVDIGYSKTDICIIDSEVPRENDCLRLSCAGKDIDSEIVKLVNDRWPDSTISEELAREWKEKYGALDPGSDTCVVDVPLENGHVQESIIEELQLACEFVVTDIVSGITRILSDHEPELREKLRNNIHILGGTSNLDGIDSFIENELKVLGGGKVFSDIDPEYGISEGALEIAKNMPADFWNQLTTEKDTEEMI